MIALPENITSAFLDEITKKGSHKHKYYDKTVEHAEEMGVHVDGDLPEKLLNIQRPNESPEVKKYRLDIWQPVTKSGSDRVVTTLNKVLNPKMYDISFPPMNVDDSLADYITEEYPFHRSIMKYIRETFTPKDMSDPNAAMVIIPKDFNIEETERFEPIPVINSSKTLTHFVDQVFYIFDIDGEVHIYTQNDIQFWRKEKQNKKDVWVMYFEHVHNFGMPPVFRLGGIVKGRLIPHYFESFMAGVLPHWNQVINLASDLAPQYTNHMFLEKWEVTTNDCDSCKGNGRSFIDVPGRENKVEISCKTCNGSGRLARSPYGIYTVNPDALTPDQALPTPPTGYISKPIEIVDKVEDRIRNETTKGFTALNLDILDKVGENQSGVAKAIDRDPMDTFILSYGFHVFEYVLPNMIMMTAAWRYPDKTLDAILPTISAPKSINILTADQLTSEYKDASNANVSANYLNHLESEIVNKKFVNNEDERKKNLAIISLNPYPGTSTDSLLTFQSLGQPGWKVHKSINIISIVAKAIADNGGFLELNFQEQEKITDDISKEQVGFKEDEELIPTIVD